MSGHRAGGRRLRARELAVRVERLLPLVLALVDASKRNEGARAQPGDFAHLEQQPFRAIEQAGAQVILREREQCLLPMLAQQRLTREKILVYADRALDLAAPPIQSAEREVGLDGVRIRIHQLEEHVERPVGLLGDEEVEAGEIIRMQFAEGPGPASAPAEMPREDPDDEGGHGDQRPGRPRPGRQIRHGSGPGSRIQGAAR